MSNKYWTDKADNADEILAADFNAAFDAIEADIAAKVDKESGKGLSGNDYTDGDKAEVGKIANKADADKVYTKAEALNKLCPKHSASGYPIAITDALADEQPLKLLVYGNNIGDLDSGKYNIPIKITGKNLFDISKITKFVSAADYTTVRPATYASVGADGVITNKIGIAADSMVYHDSKMTLTPGTYTLSADCMFISDNSNSLMVRINIRDMTNSKWIVKAVTLHSLNNTERISHTFTVTSDIEAAIDIQGVGAPGKYMMNLKISNIQLERSSAATAYEPYKGKTVTAILDEPLSGGEYIDLVSKKRNGTTDITVNGDISLYDENNITCETATAPSKLDITYYQDINKVIANLTNAILAQGGNT